MLVIATTDNVLSQGVNDASRPSSLSHLLPKINMIYSGLPGNILIAADITSFFLFF